MVAIRYIVCHMQIPLVYNTLMESPYDNTSAKTTGLRNRMV